MSNITQRSTTGSSSPKVGSDPIRTALAKESFFTSYTKMFICAVILASAFTLFSTSEPGNLSESYALCSRSGTGIYTVDAQNSQKQCLVVHGERIIDTGDLNGVVKRWNIGTTNVNGVVPTLPIRYIPSGSVIIPGISDSHCHILEYGASKQIPLSMGKTVKETVALIADYILANPDILNNPDVVIEGWGWDHASWDVPVMPSAADLDVNTVTRGRHIITESRDGHAIWVSPTILEANGPYPDEAEGGVINRDASGNPTGIFVDDAQKLIARPNLTTPELERRFSVTVKEALARGVTSLHDAGFKPYSLAFFKQKAETGGLPIRIYGMSHFDENGEYWGDRRAPLIGVGNDRLSSRSVKIFADGALRSGGAALYEPYADNPSTSGVMRVTPELLNTVVPQFLQDGWQVNVHAIGDRANGVVLDAFEHAAKKFKVDIASKRPRIEHAQIMTEEDIKRLGKLGVIASIQPSHVISDMWYAEGRLGPKRIENLYAFRNIINGGAKITLGTDFPVEEVNPLNGFFAALTRTSEDGDSPHGPDGWFPSQRLTRQEALRGMTIDPAYASFTEDILGSIEIGKRADFVVLSRDIMTVPVLDILKTKVRATVMDGRPVFGHL